LTCIVQRNGFAIVALKWTTKLSILIVCSSVAGRDSRLF